MKKLVLLLILTMSVFACGNDQEQMYLDSFDFTKTCVRGKIIGTVINSKTVPIVGAKITITHTNTIKSDCSSPHNIDTTTNTNEIGEFSFNDIYLPNNISESFNVKIESANYPTFNLVLTPKHQSGAEQYSAITTFIDGFNIDQQIILNHLPIAEAGDDITTTIGSVVNLHGEQSIIIDSPASFHWQFIEAPTNTTTKITPTTAIQPSIFISEAGKYTAQLTITDGNGDIAVDTVHIVATDSSTKPEKKLTSIDLNSTSANPTANAGNDISIQLGAYYQLNGGESSESNHNFLLYNWSIVKQPISSFAELSNAQTVTPTFHPDVIGDYVIALIVHNGVQESKVDTVVIKVTP